MEVVARQEVLKDKGLLNWGVWTRYCHTIKRSKGEGRCCSFDVPCREITWSAEGSDSAAGCCCSSDNSFISYTAVSILSVTLQFPIIQPTGGYPMELAGNSTGNFLVAQQSAHILAFITTKRLSNIKNVHSISAKTWQLMCARTRDFKIDLPKFCCEAFLWKSQRE